LLGDRIGFRFGSEIQSAVFYEASIAAVCGVSRDNNFYISTVLIDRYVVLYYIVCTNVTSVVPYYYHRFLFYHF